MPKDVKKKAYSDKDHKKALEVQKILEQTRVYGPSITKTPFKTAVVPQKLLPKVSGPITKVTGTKAVVSNSKFVSTIPQLVHYSSVTVDYSMYLPNGQQVAGLAASAGILYVIAKYWWIFI